MMFNRLDVTRLFTQMETMVKKEVQKQIESTDAVQELISDMKHQVLEEMQEQVEREVEKQVVARMREEVQREEVEVEVEVEEVQRELELQVLGRSGEQVGKYACPEMDIDFGGNDITVIMDVLNWEECAAICFGMPNCLVWTLDNRDSQHRCIPKTSDAGYRPLEGHISGAKRFFEQVTSTLAMGLELGTPPTPRLTQDPSITTTEGKYACPEMEIDFLGNDITVIMDVSNWEECAAICFGMPDCLFWTLDNRDSQHRCIPKTSDAGYRPLEGHISGARGCLQ